MITHQFIGELSTKFHTTEQNIAREYCQHLFLSYLYKKRESERMLFKGGTALRIVFDSPRFSEDLDFSAYDLSVEDINNLTEATLNDIGKEGIRFEKEVNPGTQGGTTGGYFAIVSLKLLDYSSEIKLQVSLFRDSGVLKSNTTLVQNKFISPYTIIYLTEQSLVREKVSALLERAKPRDFFDLYFILRNPKLVKFIPKVGDKLKEKTLSVVGNGWEEELKIFLPISYHHLLKDFGDKLMTEIETHVPSS